MNLHFKNMLVFFLFVLPGIAAAAPQIQVERDPGGVVASGALVTYSDTMAGGVSDVLEVNEPGESATVAFQNVPPGTYQVQRADSEEGEWSVVSPELSAVGGVVQFEDFPGPVVVVFYRLVTFEPEYQSFIIRNTGDEDLVFESVALNGTGADAFFLDDAGLPVDGILAPGDSATVLIGFVPFEAGLAEAKLNIAFNDPGIPDFEINLSGTGVPVVPGGGSPPGPNPPGFASPPTITPATATNPALFSAPVTGPPGAVIKLEASTDLGLTDEWAVIGQITLDGETGVGAFNDISDPGSIGSPSNFYRLRKD